MHPVIADHPEYQRISERRAELNRARSAALRAGSEWDAEKQRVQAEHAAALKAAIAEGKAPPPAPTLPARPDSAAVLQHVQAELEQLRREERAFFEDYGPDLLRELAAVERELAKRAAPHVQRLRELVPGWEEVRAAAVRVSGDGEEIPPATLPNIVLALEGSHRFVPAPPPEPDPAPSDVARERRTAGEQVERERLLRAHRDRHPAGRRLGPR